MLGQAEEGSLQYSPSAVYNRLGNRLDLELEPASTDTLLRFSLAPRRPNGWTQYVIDRVLIWVLAVEEA